MNIGAPKTKFVMLVLMNIVMLAVLVAVLVGGLSAVNQRAEGYEREKQQQMLIERQVENYKSTPHQTTEQLERYENELSTMVVSESTIDTQLDNLRTLSDQSGATQTIDVDVDDTLTTIDFIPVTIQATGTLAQVAQHLRLMEQTSFLFNIAEPQIVNQTTKARPNLVPTEDDSEEAEQVGTVQLTVQASLLWKPSE